MEPSNSLLSYLDSDPVQAELKMQDLVCRLIRFAQIKRHPDPEDLAQEVLMRALKRISEGQVIDCANPFSYFFGIAKFVVMENWSKPVLDPLDLNLSRHNMNTGNRAHSLDLRFHLEECLEALPEADRDLILGYYQDGPERTRIRLDITANALRIRVHRVKRKLEGNLERLEKSKSRNKC